MGEITLAGYSSTIFEQQEQLTSELAYPPGPSIIMDSFHNQEQLIDPFYDGKHILLMGMTFRKS